MQFYRKKKIKTKTNRLPFFFFTRNKSKRYDRTRCENIYSTNHSGKQGPRWNENIGDGSSENARVVSLQRRARRGRATAGSSLPVLCKELQKGISSGAVNRIRISFLTVCDCLLCLLDLWALHNLSMHSRKSEDMRNNHLSNAFWKEHENEK